MAKKGSKESLNSAIAIDRSDSATAAAAAAAAASIVADNPTSSQTKFGRVRTPSRSVFVFRESQEEKEDENGGGEKDDDDNDDDGGDLSEDDEFNDEGEMNIEL